jgi:hypothetical protein
VKRWFVLLGLLAFGCGFRWPVVGSFTSQDPPAPPPPSAAQTSGRTGATPISDEPPATEGGTADACPPQPPDDGTLVTHVDAGPDAADPGLDGD